VWSESNEPTLLESGLVWPLNPFARGLGHVGMVLPSITLDDCFTGAGSRPTTAPWISGARNLDSCVAQVAHGPGIRAAALWAQDLDWAESARTG